MRGLVAAAGLILLWQGFVWVTDVPPFLLPSPWRVAQALAARGDSIAGHALVTGAEMLAGLALGAALGQPPVHADGGEPEHHEHLNEQNHRVKFELAGIWSMPPGPR